jgi:hypothetical protein
MFILVFTRLLTCRPKDGGVLFLYLTYSAVNDILVVLFLRHVPYRSCIIFLLCNLYCSSSFILHLFIVLCLERH